MYDGAGIPDATEWQFSNGPAGERGFSNDYQDLFEGMRNHTGATFIFDLDPEQEPPVLGYQVSDHDGTHWNDRPSFEILDRKTASADLFEARLDSASVYELIPIYPDTIEEPTFCPGHPALADPDGPSEALDDASASLRVNLSMIVTAGLYAGPVTRRIVAGLVEDTLANMTGNDEIAEVIDSVELIDLRGSTGPAYLPCLNR